MLGRGLLALLLPALAVGLTACGGASLDPVAKAATKSEKAGGVKISMNILVAAPGVSGMLMAKGAVDRDQGELTFDLSNVVKQLRLPAGASKNLRVVYATEGEHQMMYIHVPFLRGILPAGKTWIKVDVEGAASAAGVDLDQILGQSQNPADTLAMLRASGDVEKIGPARIAGVFVTKYHGVVDLERAAELKGVDPSTAQHLLDAGAPKQLPVDVWVGDEDGLPYRVEIAYDTKSNGQAVSSKLELTMSDWGTDVSVETPPADQVYDASTKTGTS